MSAKFISTTGDNIDYLINTSHIVTIKGQEGKSVITLANGDVLYVDNNLETIRGAIQSPIN